MTAKNKRDDFSDRVKQILAARAGYRCSVCHEATIGPGLAPDSVVRYGDAAHITAAARRGPRFDPSLSSKERRSVENGIWVCKKHSKEIDADIPPFSIEVLRGLKKIREESAYREVHKQGSTEDQSGLMIELPYAGTSLRLFEVIHDQPYTFTTTSALRDFLRTANKPSPLLDLAPEVIIETWKTHPNVAGILSTLLSNNIDYWKPTSQVLEKLEHVCEAAIKADEWTRIALVEPLAFALAAEGRPDAHRKILGRLLENRKWRDADAARIRDYYGNIGIEIAAILRHWEDPFRAGLLRANDVSRLIDLLISNDKTLTSPVARRRLLDLLAQNPKVLSDCGAADLARTVNDFVEGLRVVEKLGKKVDRPSPR